MNHLPTEWMSDRLKDVTAINGTSLPANTDPDYEFDYLEISNVDYYGVVDPNAIERLRYEDAPSRARRRVGANSTVISSVRPNLQAAAFFSDGRDHLICSTGFNVVQSHENKLQPKFAYYALISEAGRQYFEATAKGVGYPAVDDKDFNSFSVPLPPLPEQERIVAYLDASCAAIDKVIEIKKEQLTILDELHKSTIHKAVTKGLNDNVEFVDSGIEWIGKIPNGWEIDRVKDVVFLRNTKSDDKDDVENYIELEDIEQKTGRLIAKRNTLGVESAVTLFQKGDILFGKLRPYLEKYYFADSDGRCTGEILVFKPENVDGKYFFYCVASPWFIKRCDVLSYGTKMPRVNWPTQIAVIDIPIPPREEQKHIADYLDRKWEAMRRLENNLNNQIDVLKNYRKSLIHECVTGKRRITKDDLKELANVSGS